MQSNLFAFVAAAVIVGMLASGCAKSGDAANSSGAASASASPAAPAALASSATVAAVGDVTRGAAIYTTNCAGCHGANGVSNGIGPSLVGEKARKTTAAAIAWIKNPQPPMAKLYPSPLSDKDVADVAAYVESL